MIETYFMVGVGFAVIFMAQQYFMDRARKFQIRHMEERLTRNMIKAIERLEWGENNGRTKEKN